MKSILSLSLSLSMALAAFSPGIPYAAMVAQVTPVAPSAPITAPVAQLGGGLAQGTLNLTPSLVTPSLGAGTLWTPAPSLPSVTPRIQAQALTSPRITGAATALTTRVRPLTGNVSLRQTVRAAGLSREQPARTPFARTMRALSEKGPEFGKMSTADSRSAADSDFRARIGEEPGAGAVSTGDSAEDVELIVMAPEGSGRQLTQDVYPASLSPGMDSQALEVALTQQLGRLDISMTLLKAHGASAIGAVAKINAAVIHVPESQADSLKAALQGLGLEVQVGRRFTIPQPMAASPASKTVGLKEMAKVVRADKLQDELKKVLGEPTPPAPPEAARPKGSLPASMGKALRGAFLRAFLGVTVKNPALPWAILDSWSWVDHPFMKGRFLKSVANDNDGEAHGTHTASTVVGMDIFNFQGRNYNIFPNGSASEGDILFKLDMAQKDGALATTHSWGDGSGNPAGAIEKLFTKMAAEGLHHSISAGNSGYYGSNTIGGPAIAVHNAELAINGKAIGKVKRIKAIAASDADKKTAYFSSRGPGSRTTARDPQYKDWPQKPDESGVGVNLVAAAPEGQGRNVPELGGPGMSMSGTSMSNPGVFGSFLLLSRGILVLLADQLPKLPQKELTQLAMDLARYSMTQTALKVDVPDRVGDGFIDVWAAFEFAAKTLRENPPAPASSALVRMHRLFRGLLGFAPAAAGSPVQAGRELSMKEFGILNAVGVVGSIAAGFFMHAPLLGLLGAFVAPVPVIFAYVGLMRLLGYKIAMPKVRFRPGISFGGSRRR